MSTEYPGDSDAKRIARMAVYERVGSMQPIEERRGAAVVLAGTEASEIGLLKEYLRWDANQCWFVDNHNKEGLNRVHRKWPKAKTLFGDVKYVVSGVKSISFLNLDIMGYIGQDEVDILTEARPNIEDWGMVFCSFYRGRERKGTPVRSFLDSTNLPTLEESRRAGYTDLVRKTLGYEFAPIFSMTYTASRGRGTGSSSAMGILGFQKMPIRGVKSRWFMKNVLPPMFDGSIPNDAKTQVSYIRAEAFRLYRTGFSTKQIAEMFNTHASTVASWFSQHNSK